MKTVTRFQRLASLALTLMFIIVSFGKVDPVFSFEDTVPAKEKVLIDQLKEKKESLIESEVERRRLLGSLYAITTRMKKIAEKKGTLTNDLLQAQDSVKNVAQAIQSLEDQIAKQRKILKRRLRAMYKISGEQMVGSVFSQQSAFELDSTLKGLRIVADYDYQNIRSYRENVASLASQRKKLKAQVEKLLIVEKRIRKQEDLLAREHVAKSELAASIESRTRRDLSQIQKIRSNVRVLEADAELAQLLKPSIFEKKGNLQSPLNGASLARGFGLMVDPVRRFKVSHKGWLLRPMSSSEADRTVYSIEEGTIIFNGPVVGYGDVVIIDHRDHHYSLYGGLKPISAINVGSLVRASQALGRVERDLYFEIRHFSEPEDPTSWIKNSPRVLTSEPKADENKEQHHVVME